MMSREQIDARSVEERLPWQMSFEKMTDEEASFGYRDGWGSDETKQKVNNHGFI